MANKGEQERPKDQLTSQPVNQLTGYHTPVLLHEAIEGLNIIPDGIYVDCTFGGGGHSRAILQQLNENGKLYLFDQDAAAKQNLPDDERIIFIPQNFRYLQRFLRLQKVSKVDGILADLGVSSHQFDEAERGFSIRFDADLDMRMDQRESDTAATVLKNFTEQQLHKMFEQYGEVTNSKTLAKTIVAQRALAPIRTINEFKQAVKAAVKGNPQKYFAQVFQALRIQVNDELGALKELLAQTTTLLKPGGRIAIITFHSLEDRIVKTFFRNGSFSETEADEVYGTKPESPFLIISKKPVVPGEKELKQNPRSRSAKLRVAERNNVTI
jgi:16S rRNA (cytosine1402-N4)-methyltransferase